jgi:hypothetical protein
MPRYHFHLDNGRSYPDVEGTIFPDLDEARTEAVKRSGTMLRENAETFWGGAGWKLTVTDETGLVMFTLHFAAVSSPATQGYHTKPSDLNGAGAHRADRTLI